MKFAKGQKIIAMGYRSALRGARSMDFLTRYYGAFYGYEPFTGYPVFDSPDRVAKGYAPWVHESLPTREEAVALYTNESDTSVGRHP